MALAAFGIVLGLAIGVGVPLYSAWRSGLLD